MIVVWISILAYFLLWTIFNCLCLPRFKKPTHAYDELVSILIPLRNEEANVPKLIESLNQLSYPSLEMVLYDDESTDQTYFLLNKLTAHDERYHVIRGKQDVNWNGKVHACHQLGQVATGSYYMFIDADVTLHPQCIEHVVAHFHHTNSDCLSSFPQFLYTNWLDRLLVPNMHFLVHVYLPILIANRTKWPAASAANGAFIAFTKTCYQSIGGHLAVKNSLIEDIELARTVKRANFSFQLVRAKPFIQCEMYPTAQATWNGFLKNTFSGLNRSYSAAILFSVFTWLFFIMPLPIAIYGVLKGEFLYTLPFLLALSIRMISDWRAGSNILYSVFYPISQLLLLLILWQSAWMHATKRKYVWKGREYE